MKEDHDELIAHLNKVGEEMWGDMRKNIEVSQVRYKLKVKMI